MASHRFMAVACCALALVISSCSIKKFAVNKIGDALSESGTTYASDDDIELVGDALPFALKLIESLLETSPDHPGLLRTACEGFTTYSYVYVQSEAETLAESDARRSRELRSRSRKLYHRALGYCRRGLDVAYPGISDGLDADPSTAVTKVTNKEDVPLVYWTAASLGLGISTSKGDAAALARIPEVEALLRRGLELDETWNGGALHEFEVVLAASEPGRPDYARIERHYQRALELSEGHRAGLFVAYAEASALRKQEPDEFRAALDRALAVDPDEYPEVRLANLVAQRRAAWLLSRIDDLFLAQDEGDGASVE
jgi:predicted anti-sigma-YlaC factor YlaD